MSSHPTTYFHESMQTAGTCVISWEESHDPYMNLIGMFSEFVFLLAYMSSLRVQKLVFIMFRYYTF